MTDQKAARPFRSGVLRVAAREFAGELTVTACRFGVDSGNSIASGGVVSRSPTLSLETRKFAFQLLAQSETNDCKAGAREPKATAMCYLTAEVKTSSIAGTAHPATGSWFTRESVQSGCATPPYEATPE
jgi:hypothetical protein